MSGIYEERVKLQRVLTEDLCWKCAQHRATTEIGLCQFCRKKLVEAQK